MVYIERGCGHLSVDLECVVLRTLSVIVGHSYTIKSRCHLGSMVFGTPVWFWVILAILVCWAILLD